MSIKYINSLLGALPSGAVFWLSYKRGELKDGRFMARAFPGDRRRVTNLGTGSDFFLPIREPFAEIIEGVRIEEITIAIIP